MFLLKKFIFKLMELGLGLRTCFTLETRNPIFVNFRLSEEETKQVQARLPRGFELKPIKFCQSDPTPAYWVSYNLYELKYPKKELAHIRKVRCEINTFVVSPEGRKGIFVFCGSPYVSKETKLSFFGVICDLAERMVVFIYGCGKLTKLRYDLSPTHMTMSLHEDAHDFDLKESVSPSGEERLSDDYWAFNDVSFFNGGKTFDLVNVSHDFFAARLQRAEVRGRIRGPCFDRAPDRVYYHRGDIAYMVDSLNRRPGA